MGDSDSLGDARCKQANAFATPSTIKSKMDASIRGGGRLSAKRGLDLLLLDGRTTMKRAALSALCATLIATAATAAPVVRQEIRTKAGKPWVHKGSKFAFPAMIGPFSRRMVEDISDGKQIDLAGTYDEPGSQTLASVYIYRPAMPDPALWFDISSWYLQRSQLLGGVGKGAAPTAFQMGSGSDTSALRQSYALASNNVGSTGLAIVPMGRWIVKLRMTSRTLSPAALDQAMRDFLYGLSWPSNVPRKDTVPIGACLRSLTNERAEELEQPSAVILVGAMLASMAEKPEADAPTEPPARLCRDDIRSNASRPLYQLDDGATGYLQPLGDNGTLLVVRNDPTSAALIVELAGGDKSESRELSGQKDDDKKASAYDGRKGFFRITLMTPEQWAQYPAFDSLPSIEQTTDVVENRRPLSVTSFLKKTEITLDPATFK
ncbi:hypothetical protein [Rhizorhabdus phycosphaerae]|uniref:hypothetical protein n=1 Tax=Rhizorhabdus phycosphaerae TaxID=2711156 RepID=UPI0013EAE55E|nr:hypothetical protein [Rhizorhabdus phycosphaerae]